MRISSFNSGALCLLLQVVLAAILEQSQRAKIGLHDRMRLTTPSALPFTQRLPMLSP